MSQQPTRPPAGTVKPPAPPAPPPARGITWRELIESLEQLESRVARLEAKRTRGPSPYDAGARRR